MKHATHLVGIAVCALVAALLIGYGGAVVGLHEPISSVTRFLVSLAVSGGLALGFGLVVVLVGMPLLPRLALKIGAGYLVGSATAIITIAAMAPLLFAAPHAHQLLILFLVCFLVISLGLAVIVSSSVTRRLETLTAATRRVAEGELGTQVDIPPRDEIYQLAGAFNRMSADLEHAFARIRLMEEEHRRLVAAISHDLYTPLTSIRLMVEAMQDGVVNDAGTMASYLERMHHDIRQLGYLIDDLFDLSRLVSGNPELELESVDVCELVADTIAGLRPLAERHGVLVTIERAAGMRDVLADPVQLRRALANVVQNAIQHTPAGGTVTVTARTIDGDAVIDIVDTGAGIAASDLPHVFDLFYRGQAPTPPAPGKGLGLTIAQAIVKAHGGTIAVESKIRGGARFTICLPIAR